jgi:hydroxyacylglutathione hydrolase
VICWFAANAPLSFHSQRYSLLILNSETNSIQSFQCDIFALGPFETQAYVLSNAESCLVIDPGMQPEPLLQFLDERGLRVEGILLTHAHLDHIAGCSALHQRDACPIFMNEADRFLYDGLTEMGAAYGFHLEPAPQPTRALEDGQELSLAGLKIEVIATPGHSPGGLCFLLKDARGASHLFCGDTLFTGSYGRTDLPGGDLRTLERSIRERLFTLDERALVYPGHGPSTTLADESKTNPILFVEIS